MYRRSCGRTAERIDASRRPRIDFLVVKLTSGLRTTSSPPVLPESLAVGRTRSVPILGIPSDMSTGMSNDGLCRPSADRNKGNMTLTVWTGWTTSSAALHSSRRGSRGFFLQLKQITDSESLFTALQSLTGTFFSPGSPWLASTLCPIG